MCIAIKSFYKRAANFLVSIVASDESWIHHYDPISHLEAKVWKRSGEQTSTRLRQEKSDEKIMMIIFWDKDGVLLTEYLSRGTTINDFYYSKERKGVYVIFIYNTKILLHLTFDEQTDKKRYASTANRTHDQDWFT